MGRKIKENTHLVAGALIFIVAFSANLLDFFIRRLRGDTVQ
jgi:hypothetical protein